MHHGKCLEATATVTQDIKREYCRRRSHSSFTEGTTGILDKAGGRGGDTDFKEGEKFEGVVL